MGLGFLIYVYWDFDKYKLFSVFGFGPTTRFYIYYNNQTNVPKLNHSNILIFLINTGVSFDDSV